MAETGMSRQSVATNITWRDVAGQHLGRWNPGPELRKAGFRALDLWAAPPGPRLAAEGWQGIGFDGCPEGAHDVAAKITPRRLNTPLGKAAAERIGLLLTTLAHARSRAIREDERARPRPLTRAADTPRHRRARAALPPRRITQSLTMNDVFDGFITAKQRELNNGKLSANYFNNLRQNILLLRRWCGDMPPVTFTKDILEDAFWRWRDQRGPAAAEKLFGALRTSLTWAQGRERYLGWLPSPVVYTKLNLPKAGQRLRVGTPEEMTILLRAFDDPDAIYDELGTPQADRTLAPCPSGGDGVILQLWTCARVGDALALRHKNLIDTTAGRMLEFLPSKSRRRGEPGKWLTVPVLGPLGPRLDAIPARQRRLLYHGPYLVISEDTREPYIVNDPNDPTTDRTKERKHQRFTQIFNTRRALAATICPSLIGEGRDQRGRPVLNFRAQDFRDTAATRLYAATGSLEEVSVYHGSSARELVQLFNHYIEVQPDFAATVGKKLEAWCHRHDIRI